MSLQSAIDACPPGGRLALEPVRYQLDATLRITRAIEIVGCRGTVLVGRGTLASVTTDEGVEIDGVGFAPEEGGTGLEIRGFNEGSSVRRCRFWGGARGLVVARARDFRLERCTFRAQTEVACDLGRGNAYGEDDGAFWVQDNGVVGDVANPARTLASLTAFRISDTAAVWFRGNGSFLCHNGLHVTQTIPHANGASQFQIVGNQLSANNDQGTRRGSAILFDGVGAYSAITISGNFIDCWSSDPAIKIAPAGFGAGIQVVGNTVRKLNPGAGCVLLERTLGAVVSGNSFDLLGGLPDGYVARATQPQGSNVAGPNTFTNVTASVPYQGLSGYGAMQPTASR